MSLVLDFDDTLTICRSKKLSRDLFGDEDRIEMLQEYIREWKNDGIDLYILSHNTFNFVYESIDLIFNVTDFEEIIGNKNIDKAEYVNKLKYDTVVFVDNDKTQYEGVDPSVITIKINDEGGLTEEDMEKIDKCFEESPKKEKKEEHSFENAPFITPKKRSAIRTPSSRNTKTPKSAGVDYKIFGLF